MKITLLGRLGILLIPVILSGCASQGLSSGTPSAGFSRPQAARPVLDLPHNTDALRSAKAHVELGMGYVDLGRFDVALDEAQVALRADSSYSPAYHLLGITYMMLKDTGAARENFDRALSLAPGDPDVQNTYGMFRCQNGEVQEGLRLLETAARNPYYRNPTRAYTNAGLCYLSIQDTSSAQAQFRQAVEADPSNATALYHAANLAYQNKDYKEAQKWIIQLHQTSSTSAASAWLGYLIATRLNNADERASFAAQLKGRFQESEEYKWLMQGKTQ